MPKQETRKSTDGVGRSIKQSRDDGVCSTGGGIPVSTIYVVSVFPRILGEQDADLFARVGHSISPVTSKWKGRRSVV